MEFLMVGIGGAVGSITRYQLGKIIAERSGTTFPLGTFIINIAGAVLLGVLCGLNTGGNYYLLLGDGFLGAFTTFSTFMYEGFNLFQEKERLNALIYIVASLLLGLVGYAVGYGLAGILI